MANTTNFNWATPDDTDLVKDGAAAIRTLGSSIDTSFVDLKGGTTGQVLSKASNTDLDYTWVTTNDADAIQNSIVDAKGDLIAASANDTPAILAVGTNGYVLTPASGETTGLKWSVGANFHGCSLTKSVNQTIANNTESAVTWDGETFDTDGFHSTVTNTNRVTIPTGFGGYYQLSGQLLFNTNATGRRAFYIKKNGNYLSNGETFGSSANATTWTVSYILNLAANDYVELTVYQNSGGNLDLLNSTYYSNFQVAFLGA